MGPGSSNHGLEELYNRLCEQQTLTPRVVMQVLVQTLGGERITIPSQGFLGRKERNGRIRNAFHGGNYRELSARFGLTEKMVRRIVHSTERR